MEITIEQLQQLYNDGKTKDKKFKRDFLSSWVNMPNDEHSYCDMIFKQRKNKYMICIKKSDITDQNKERLINCISL